MSAVSSPGLRNLLQTCVDLGVKYGQFEVKESLLGTAGLAQRIKTMATECRLKLTAELKGILGNIGASLSLQVGHSCRSQNRARASTALSEANTRTVHNVDLIADLEGGFNEE